MRKHLIDSVAVHVFNELWCARNGTPCTVHKSSLVVEGYNEAALADELLRTGMLTG